MIQTEPYPGYNNLVRTYSDAGMKIIQDGTGILYDEAVDPVEMGRTYTESDIPLETWEPPVPPEFTPVAETDGFEPA